MTTTPEHIHRDADGAAASGAPTREQATVPAAAPEARTERSAPGPRTEVVDAPTEKHPAVDRRDVLVRQKERFGGIKWGSAFFGWLTVLGAAVLLSVLLAAVGNALGLSAAADAGQAADQVGQLVQAPAGVVGGVAAGVVVLIAYFCGGYVAGRMARFGGAKQGVAVWIWSIVVVVAVAALVAVVGNRTAVEGVTAGLPPSMGADLSVAGAVATVAALVIGLVGAVLGGLAGMRFHRRVDRADLDPR